MIVEGFAKVNLSLRVRPRDTSGYHPIRSLVQSIGWADRVTLGFAHDEDGFTVDGDLPAEEDNLAWRAVNAVRRDAGSRRPVLLHLEKRIAVAAGLGGGSADAAAGLVAASRLLQSAPEAATRLAPELGSDVAFCLVGGTAWMEGRGEVVTGVPIETDYAVAVMVPPFELSTAEVYRRWDEMDGPAGVGVEGRSLPPSLREYAPFANDLVPAALDLNPHLGEWKKDLGRAWGRPALLSGSGPAVFGFFSDEEEANAAIAVVEGARGLWAGVPVSFGTRLVES
ncbi:MAG: 4-(cytidine 5'-diphospho)-2-C-methyl-D-erythritol kinase [Actinomycetota bacterium]